MWSVDDEYCWIHAHTRFINLYIFYSLIIINSDITIFVSFSLFLRTHERSRRLSRVFSYGKSLTVFRSLNAQLNVDCRVRYAKCYDNIQSCLGRATDKVVRVLRSHL